MARGGPGDNSQASLQRFRIHIVSKVHPKHTQSARVRIDNRSAHWGAGLQSEFPSCLFRQAISNGFAQRAHTGTDPAITFFDDVIQTDARPIIVAPALCTAPFGFVAEVSPFTN